jgi:F-type H+-transporting ATPase subunit b
MISLDLSLIPAILIFLTVIFALNYLLFKPLMKVQAERAGRTTGVLDAARRNLESHLDMFNRYQSTIKNGRLEGYRLQEQVRSEAMKKRAEALAGARTAAEQLVKESRSSIQGQVQTSKARLELEAEEIARGIAVNILQRSA